MAAFIGESDITKTISDYGKMLKYRENDTSVDLYKKCLNVGFCELNKYVYPISNSLAYCELFQGSRFVYSSHTKLYRV